MNLQRILFAMGVVIILGVGAWFRLSALGERPIHFDEATGARILGERLETGHYVFDPKHFHGPLLTFVTAPVVQMRGESSWDALTKRNLRLGVALLSLLTVVCALGIGDRRDGLAAAAFVATCPLLAYYGRMYIHEPVFIALGSLTLLLLLAFLKCPGVWTALGLGAGAGLMAATRETFVISLFAWGAATLFWPWPSSDSLRQKVVTVWKSHGRYLYIPMAMGLAVIAVFYSDFGRNPTGPIAFVRTYFDYTVVPGHEKPMAYYLELLLRPKSGGGLWWTEGGVLLLALYGYVRCRPGVCKFLVHSGIVYLAVFSLLAYKTPWLPCLGWLHICLAAGMAASQLLRDGRWPWRLFVVVGLAVVLSWQTVQCRRAVFRFAADARNPYAYVPTSKDAERMATWLDDLAEEVPALKSDVVTVVGGSYWPLPWYLRGFERVGYWGSLPDDAQERSLILLVSSGEGVDPSALEDSHVCFPRGLRHEVLVIVAIRKDIWEGLEP